MRRARKARYKAPTFWWAQTHHHFEHCTDREVPPEAVGRAISFYSGWTGITTTTWFGSTQFSKRPGVEDTWPVRPTPKFLEGKPPRLVLARPEGWMADRTRRDNLIELIQASRTPVAVTSLGTVPMSIPDASAGGLNGWQIKQRGLTRSLAFWLNQGAPFVLLHSAYENRRDEMTHALMPYMKDPLKFRWSDSAPLTTLRLFVEPLAGAKKLTKLEPLKFRYALAEDAELIPATGKAGPIRASDAVALLPFQIDRTRFAVAAYVVTPNIALPIKPVQITLEVDKPIRPEVATLRPYTQRRGAAAIVQRGEHATTIRFEIADDVTWMIFRTR